MENETSVSHVKHRRTVPPKLRKNKRLEKQWGDKYYNLVKETVFLLRAKPLVPAEPPASLRQEEDDCQSLYVCDECRDCFRFLNSLEVHNSRRSWILGYWCHSCFFTECRHAPKDQSPCTECQGINRRRKLFLRSKGLKKGRKLGCIKIFYNQCQFFAHLKRHGTTYVDMADVMLMPIPSNIDKQHHDDLEKVCGSIMERMFLTRTHIMDWLKSQELGNDWWKSFLKSTSEYRENKLAEMFAATGVNRRGRKLPKRSITSQQPNITRQVSPAALMPCSSTVSFMARSKILASISDTIESVIAQGNWEDRVSPIESRYPQNPPPLLAAINNRLESVEDDDDPCITADIAFVDCGPAAKTYSSDVAFVLPSNADLNKSPTGNVTTSKAVTVMPSKSEGHEIVRMSKPPLILRHSRVHSIVRSASSSAFSLGDKHVIRPKIAVKKFAHERLKSPPNLPPQTKLSLLTNKKLQALRKLAPAPNRITSPNTSMPSVMEITRAVETSNKVVAQASLSSFGSKILTVHSPKNADISKIIRQLPPDVINGKKLVFIGQDSERFNVLPKNDAIPSNLGMIKIQSDSDKAQIINNSQTKLSPVIVSSIGIEKSVNVASDSSEKNSKTKMQQLCLDGKVIYQNGKKFIIRPARKPIPESKICNNLSNLKLPVIPKRVNLSTFLANGQQTVTSQTVKSVDTNVNKIPDPSTPSHLTSCPSPSTSDDHNESESRVQMVQNGKEIENVEKRPDSPTSVYIPMLRNDKNSDAVECFSIKTDAGKMFVDFSNTKGSSYIQLAVNYKQQMLENFRRLGDGRKKQYIDHLVEINAEYERMAGVVEDAPMSENSKAIKNLAITFKKQSPCSEEERDVDEGSSVDAINKIFMDLKETKKPLSICPTCNKSTETESQVMQFSKGINQSLGCRKCNNYICHICDLFQGNMSRFEAHLRFHAKKEPFTCPECFRKFCSFQRLETHTWTVCFHSLARRWFKCRICNIEGFPDMDAVTKHFVLAHSKLKIACPECGILLKSQAAFQTHKEEDHPKAIELLKPVRFMLCDIGNCVVRLENYRTHMDHHTAVINMLYYKCCFCPFVVKTTRQSKEQIRIHLYSEHSERLSELTGSQDLDDEIPVNCYGNTKLQSKDVVELEQDSDVLETAASETEVMTTDIVKNSELDKLQPLEDGVERSVWSINLDSSKAVQIMTLENAVNTPENVITEFSSSPKIFDVRSVTPDSYAELGRATKDISQSVSDSIVEGSEDQLEDSRIIKMGEQMKSPGTNASNATELRNEASRLNEKTDVIQTKEVSESIVHASTLEKHKKIAIGSTTVNNLSKPVKVWPRKSVSGIKQGASVSLLKSENNCSEKKVADATKAHDAEPRSVITNNSGTDEATIMNDLSLSNIPKPPPLARIPQRLLEISEPRDVVEEEEALEVRVTTQRSPMKSRRKHKRPWRIALNAPIGSSELINYHCHLCGEFINTSWSVLRGHFSSRHSQDYNLSIITPRLLRMTDDFISEGYKEVLGPKKRKSDGTVASSKRRKRWNPKKHFDQHPLGPGLCVQQESLEDGEGNFVCKKCDLQCDDISSLRTHIGTNHRIKDHYLVCLECGENFVVEPSLQMHLKAFHRIKDPCEYMSQNTEYVKKMTETIEDEGKTGIANQCHVCMAVFEDKLAVDKHLRVHGMAFLNRKRIEAQNAARNPEKKIKIDKPDDNCLAATVTKSDKTEKSKPDKIGPINGESKKSDIKDTNS